MYITARRDARHNTPMPLQDMHFLFDPDGYPTNQALARNHDRFPLIMQYNTVFEIGLKSFPWGGLLHPVPFLLIGMLLFKFAKGKEVYQVTGFIVSVLAGVFFCILAVKLVPNFIELRHAFESGDSSIVEGVVENFHPAPVLGAAKESFSVGGVDFSYNALDLTTCFHNAPFRKGPIKSGLAVRVYYKDGCIQRLDVRQ
jgi:hypothetical protein